MTREAVSYLGSEFNNFLYTPVGVEKNRMQLSVLSGLARQKIDPGQEAAQLTGLSEKMAVQRLMLWIPALSDGSWVNPDRGKIAVRLVALLPRHASSGISSRRMISNADAIKSLSGFILYVVFVLFTLGIQWIATNHEPQVDNTHNADLQRGLRADAVVKFNPAMIQQAEAGVNVLNSSGVINAH
jgi:hypothetical protein